MNHRVSRLIPHAPQIQRRTRKEYFNSCPIKPGEQKKYPCRSAPYLATDNNSRYFNMLDAYGK